MHTQVSQRYSKVDLFSAKGRIGKKSYLFYSTITLIISAWAIASILGLLPLTNNYMQLYLLSAVIAIAISSLAYLTIQRCHDFDKNGWLAIFAVIPFANFFFGSIPSTNGLNRYGEPPESASSIITITNVVLILVLISTVAYFLLNYFNFL